MKTALTLDQLNAAPINEAIRLLAGVYENSPWIAEQALTAGPFASLAQLKHAMARIVTTSERDVQWTLIRAHPELAGQAMIDQALTAESSHEQSKAGLTQCSPAELTHLQQLNTAYHEKFGFPFILAVRGPRGIGLSRQDIIDTFERRLLGHPEFELAECLRNIHRIAELRLNDKFGSTPELATRCGTGMKNWRNSVIRATRRRGNLPSPT